MATAFAVLAHELRGCTSVIQGYVRLLQQSRGADSPEAGLLTKLMDATGRLTTIGKQSTELAVWAQRDETNGDDQGALTMMELLTEAAALQPAVTTVTDLPAGIGAAIVTTSSRAALTAAIGAVIAGVARNTVDQAVAIDGRAGTDAIALTLRARDTEAILRDAADDADARTAFLGQGGQNLALILASHVLHAHGAQLSAASARPPLVRLHFATRGQQ